MGRNEPPCKCDVDDWIGTVSAGNPLSGAFCSVVTCADHAKRSAGYVQMETGLDSNPLLTFEEARR